MSASARRTTVLLAVAVLASSSALAQASADYSLATKPVSVVSEAGTPLNVAANGTHVFVAATDRLSVYDVSTPRSPSLVGELTIQASDVAAQGDFVYVTPLAQYVGLRVVDVSDPAAPFKRSTLLTIGSGEQIRVVGSYAYVADGLDGYCRIIDISNPDAPFKVHSIPESGIVSVDTDGTTAYILQTSSGWPTVDIYDVADPTAPALTGSFGVAGNLYPYVPDLRINGSMLYVPVESYGGGPFTPVTASFDLVTYDVTNPAAPVVASYLNLGAATEGAPVATGVGEIELTGSLAIIAGTVTLDVSSPGSPVLLSRSTGFDGTSCAVTAGHAYLAGGGEADLEVLQVSATPTPATTMESGAGGQVSDVAAIGTTIYGSIANGYGGLAVFDASGSSIVRKSDVGVAGGSPTESSVQVVASDPWVFVRSTDCCDGAGWTVSMFDASSPPSPVLVDDVVGGYGIDVDGGFLYLGGYAQLDVYEIGAGTLTARGSVAVPSATTVDAVTASGGRAYVPTSTGFEIFDVTDPDAPVALGSYAGGVGHGITVAGSLAYFGEDDALSVVDVSNPAAPVLLSTTALMAPADRILLSGSEPLAYVRSTSGAFRILSLAVPSSPLLLGEAGQEGFYGGLCLLNDSPVYNLCPYSWLDYVDSTWLGVFPPQLTPPTAAPVVDVRSTALRLDPGVPNPVRSGRSSMFALSLPRGGAVHAEVLDVAGRRVKTLVDGVRESGLQEIRWDGRSGDGGPVPAGVYFVRVETPAGTATRKAVVLR